MGQGLAREEKWEGELKVAILSLAHTWDPACLSQQVCPKSQEMRNLADARSRRGGCSHNSASNGCWAGVKDSKAKSIEAREGPEHRERELCRAKRKTKAPLHAQKHRALALLLPRRHQTSSLCVKGTQSRARPTSSRGRCASHRESEAHCKTLSRCESDYYNLPSPRWHGPGFPLLRLPAPHRHPLVLPREGPKPVSPPTPSLPPSGPPTQPQRGPCLQLPQPFLQVQGPKEFSAGRLLHRAPPAS